MTPQQRSILAVATLTQAVAMGVTLGVFPRLLEPREAAIGASRTTSSTGPILVMFALCAAGILAGGVLDKGHVRKAMFFGAGLLTVALLLASWAPNLGVLAVAALAAGFSIPFIGPLAGMTLVTRVFSENQGRAFGIMSMGPALGMGFFAGAAGFLLQTLEWRSIYLLLAAVTTLLLVPAIGLVIPAHVPAPDVEGAEAADTVGLGDVIRRPVFWWSAMVFALSAGIATGWTNHVAAFLGEFDMTESQITSLVAAQFWMGVPGAFLFGTLSDRLPVTGLYVSMLAFEAFAFACFGSGISALSVAILGVTFGLVIGGLIPLYMALIGGRLEPQILGRAMGLSNLVMLPVMALATVGAAGVYEADGSYARAALLCAVGSALAIVSLVVSNRSAKAT
jgi:predicted MFS family arabinose efflux permease